MFFACFSQIFRRLFANSAHFLPVLGHIGPISGHFRRILGHLKPVLGLFRRVMVHFGIFRAFLVGFRRFFARFSHVFC